MILVKFLKRANEIHGGRYDYSLVEYINSRTKVRIICHKHGIFEQTPKCHIQGRGCPGCGIDKLKSNASKFIERAMVVHGDLYDYSNVIYSGPSVGVKIVCKKHGVFIQEPRYHIRGNGCKECAREKLKNSKTLSSDFIKRASIIHNNKYTYHIPKKTIKISDLIDIVCEEHGVFKQIAANHLSGKGCNACGVDRVASFNRYSISSFISRARIVHGDTYTYTDSVYDGFDKKIEITCNLHGNFWQIACEHLRGSGCPKCSRVISSGHSQILQMIGNEKILINDRTAIYPSEIDILLPDRLLGIEFHGAYWHSYDKLESQDQRLYHYNKHDIARAAGIKLLQIYDYEWYNKNGIVSSIINHHLSKSIKIYARQCVFSELSKLEASEFFEANHIQGMRYAKYYFGLKYDGMLVCAMSISRNHDCYELIRLANKIGVTVVGGASKLLKNIPLRGKLVTFADRRYSIGNVYRKLGFTQVSITKPNYCYLYSNGDYAYSRQQCQKSKLYKLLDVFDDTLSESQNMFNNRYRRLWDAGNYKFELVL